MENESEKKHSDEGTSEKAFRHFGKRVDEFLVELDEAGDKLKVEFEAKYQELKESAEKLRKEAENKERWTEVESSLRKAGEELSNAVKAAFRKKDA